MVLKEILAVFDDIVVKYIYLKHNNKTTTIKMINNKISLVLFSTNLTICARVLYP